MNREKINAARAELTEQAQKEGTALATFIEEHINKLLVTEEAAEKVKGKTLSALIGKITAHAKKKAKNGSAMLTDEEVAKLAEDYYGLTADKRPEPEKHERMNVLDLI